MVLYSNPAERAYQVSIHLIVALIAVTAVFPLVYVIGMSMTTQTELIKRSYFVIIPLEPTLQGYERILGQTAVWRAFMISVLRSTIGPAMALVLTLVGAYCLSIRTLPGRGIILLLVLASIIFPGGLIPSYLVMRRLGLLNNFWVMILPFLGHSFGLLVIKVFIENPAGGAGGVGPHRRRRAPADAGLDHHPAHRAGAGGDRHVQYRRALELLVRCAGLPERRRALAAAAHPCAISCWAHTLRARSTR